jgi:hypothetical protein
MKLAAQAGEANMGGAAGVWRSAQGGVSLTCARMASINCR